LSPPRVGHGLRPRRRQDGGPLLHRVPVVLERRRALRVPLGMAAMGQRRAAARAVGPGVRPGPVRLPEPHAGPPAAPQRARALLALIRQIPEPSRWLLWASAAYPAYYVALSLYLTGRWSSRGQPPA